MSWAGLASATFQIACIGAFAAQLLIDSSDNNILAASLALLSSSVTLAYLRLSRAFATLPLSSFAVLGLCLTTQWGALVAQSTAWTPIVENLRDPVRTFALLGAFQCVAIVAHVIHRTLRPLIRAREFGARALRHLGIFDVPAAGSLWVMGAVGFAGFAIGAAPGEVDLGDRLLAGFWPFAWAPFIIPILHARHGAAYCNLRLHGAALVVYAVMAVGLAMALNYRILMIQGATTTALMTLLIVLRSDRRFDPRTLWKVGPLVLIAVALTQPLAYLATAMVIARADRGHVSPIELLQETLNVLQDEGAIRRHREGAKADSKLSAYDETYIANTAVARFVETKFHDNAFFFATDLSDRERDGLEHEVVDRAWSQLPYPVLRAFKVSVDKNILSHSVGDYYANLRTGVPLEGLKTGSLLADCLALFEEFAPIVYLLLCLALFWVWDAQSMRDAAGGVQISVLAMLQAYRLFTYGITNESLPGGLGLFLRGFWQNLLFYLLIYWMAKTLFPSFTSPNSDGTRGR
jgi:hypothetical protein